MLTEDQFIQELETRTGLKLGEDFGFILGTQVPWIQSHGMQSAVRQHGFQVWNRLKDGTSRYLNLQVGNNTLEVVSLWLQPNINDDTKVEMLSKMLSAVPVIKIE
jgi:hypothetical protein